MSELFSFYLDVRKIVKLSDEEGAKLTAELGEWVDERNIEIDRLPAPHEHLIMLVVEGVVGAVEFKLRMSEWLTNDPFPQQMEQVVPPLPQESGKTIWWADPFIEPNPQGISKALRNI